MPAASLGQYASLSLIVIGRSQNREFRRQKISKNLSSLPAHSRSRYALSALRYAATDSWNRLQETARLLKFELRLIDHK